MVILLKDVQIRIFLCESQLISTTIHIYNNCKSLTMKLLTKGVDCGLSEKKADELSNLILMRQSTMSKTGR